jgi:hypothetical protein
MHVCVSQGRGAMIRRSKQHCEVRPNLKHVILIILSIEYAHSRHFPFWTEYAVFPFWLALADGFSFSLFLPPTVTLSKVPAPLVRQIRPR